MPSRKVRTILVSTLLLLLFCIASVAIFNTLLQNQSVQHFVLDQLSEATGYDLHASKIILRIWGGIGISVHKLEARSRRYHDKIMASSAGFTFNVKELIRGRIVPTNISLSHPIIDLTEQGDISFYKNLLITKLPGLQAFSLEDGQVSVENLPYKFQELRLSASQESREPVRLVISLEGKVEREGKDVPFVLKGTITQEKASLTNPFAELTLKTGEFPLTWITWPDSLPIKDGRARTNVRIKAGLDGPLSSEGQVIMKDLEFLIVDPEITKHFSFSQLTFDFESLYSKSVFQISPLRVRGPDFSLAGSVTLDLRDNPNPHLDLEVESPFMPLNTFKRIFPSPLFPQWVENRLFPLLKQGDVRLDLLSLKGTYDQIQNYDQPENPEVFSMRISANNLEVFEEGGLPFRDISGELNIENGTLLLSVVKGRFGKSHIRNSTLNVSDLFGDLPKFHISVAGLFELNDLIQQSEMPLTPSRVRQELQGFTSVSGNLEAHLKLDYKYDWDLPRISKGEFEFNDCMITHKGLPLPVSLDEAGITIDSEKQSRFSGKGLWGKSKFQVSGSAGTSWEKIKAHVVGQADMNEIMGLLSPRPQSPIKFSDLTACSFSLFKRKGLWLCKGEVNLEGVVMETPSLTIDPPGKNDKITFSAEIYPKERVSFRKLECHLRKSTFELSGSYNLKRKDFLNLKLSTNKLRLEDLGIRYKKTKEQAKGILFCQTEINAFLRNPIRTSVTGEVEGKDLYLVVGGLSSPISDCDLKVGLSDKKLSIHFLKMKVGETRIHIKGDLIGWDGLKGDLTVDAGYLNVSDFISDRSKSSPSGKKSDNERFTRQTDISIKLLVEEGRWETFKYGPLEAECAFRSGDFYIRRSKVQTNHGLLTVNGHVKRGKKPEMSFSSYVNITRQPVQEVLEAIGVHEKYLDGHISMEAVLFTQGKETKGLISGLTGGANILVEKGRIKKSHIILKILDFLSLQKILKKRPPDITREGFYFEFIKGHIALDKGILKTDSLIMKSPVFNAAVKGKLDLTKERLDLDVGTQPLGTIDLILSKIPTVGYILTGKDKSLVIFPFKVQGSLSKPDVHYVPLKNLESNVIGFLNRLFLTPGRLFKKMSKITKDLAEKGIPLPKKNF